MQLKVLTLNLYNGGELMDQALAFLAKEKPDVMLFQEVYNGQDVGQPQILQTYRILQENFSEHQSFFSPELKVIRTKEGEGSAEIGNAIFSRFEIMESDNSHFDVPYGEYPEWPQGGDFSHYPQNLQWVDLELGGKPLRVINLHGIWGLDGGDNPRRLAMSDTIIEAVKGKHPVVLAGDFNIKPDTQTIRNIETHLINLFKDELNSTFNMKHKTNPGYATAVVDMMFVSHDVKVIAHYCPDDDVSDHRPLVAVVEI